MVTLIVVKRHLLGWVTGLSLLCAGETIAAGPIYFVTGPSLAWFLIPLVMSAIIVIGMLCDPAKRQAVNGPLIFVLVGSTAGILLTFLGNPGIVLALLLMYFGPWILLLYLFILLVSGNRKRIYTAAELAERGIADDPRLSSDEPAVDFTEWKTMVRQFASLGFNDDEILGNLVTRGLSKNQAKTVLAKFRQESGY